LPDGSVFAPTAWVSRERWEALPLEQRQGYAHISPDVVFELLSPSNTLNGMRSKATAYLANGARLAVLIDPLSPVVEFHRASDVVVSQDDGVALTPELEGFVLDVAAIVAYMRDGI
jgi:Uma2 family endonuclease